MNDHIVGNPRGGKAHRTRGRHGFGQTTFDATDDQGRRVTHALSEQVRRVGRALLNGRVIA